MNSPKTNPNYWKEINEIEDDIKNNRVCIEKEMSNELKAVRIKNSIVDLTKPIKAPPMIISGGQDMYH